MLFLARGDGEQLLTDPMRRCLAMTWFLLLWRARAQEPHPVSFHCPQCERQRMEDGLLRDRKGRVWPLVSLGFVDFSDFLLISIDILLISY